MAAATTFSRKYIYYVVNETKLMDGMEWDGMNATEGEEGKMEVWVGSKGDVCRDRVCVCVRAMCREVVRSSEHH